MLQNPTASLREQKTTTKKRHRYCAAVDVKCFKDVSGIVNISQWQ